MENKSNEENEDKIEPEQTAVGQNKKSKVFNALKFSWKVLEKIIMVIIIFISLVIITQRVSDNEKAFIKDLAENYVLPNERLNEIYNIDNDDQIIANVSQIKNRRAALELIKELCYLAHADDELSDKETLFIGKVGQAMNIELEKIEQISNWVIDKIILAEEARIIFEEV